MKGILLVNIPKRCSMRKFKVETDEGYAYCGCLDFDYQVNEYMKSLPKDKPDWCPIHQLPEKDNGCYFPDEYQDGYASGWNHCIEKIRGGDKERE